MSDTPNGERDAWGMAATMDHSDIRGLGTALHLFFAGLPRSKNGDHPEGCSLKSFEDSPHRSHSSRSRLGVWLVVKVLCVRTPMVDGERTDSGADLYLTCHVPNKSGELAGDSDADFVLMDLASHAKASPTFSKTQLRPPRDIADNLRLPLLADLEHAADLRFEAIIPRSLHQDTSRLFVAAFSDRTLAAGGTTRELRRHQSQVRHERPRMSEASDVADLGDESDRTDESLHSSAGTALIVPINRGAARSASAIAIAIDSL